MVCVLRHHREEREELNASLTAALLHEDEEPKVLDEAKLIFYAEAELGVRYLFLELGRSTKLATVTQGELVPLVLHPVLAKYLLELDIATQAVDYDYDLPNEELTSPAVHPPMPLIRLESHQGYPQIITVQASNDSLVGVNVQDVLRAIQEDVRKLSRRREWTKLNAEDRAAVDDAFRERCNTEEELAQGPCRVDYLRGRNRIQILPKLSPDGEMLPAPGAPVEDLTEHLSVTFPGSSFFSYVHFLILCIGMN